MRVMRDMLPSRTKTSTGDETATGDNREGRDISEARGPIEVYVNVTAITAGAGNVTFNVDEGIFVERTKGYTLGTLGPLYRTSVFPSPPAITATGFYLIGTLNDYGTLMQFRWALNSGASSVTFEIYLVYEAGD